MENSHLSTYRRLEKKVMKNHITVNFIDGPFVKITGRIIDTYDIQFIDIMTDELVYHVTIQTNQQVHCPRRWVTEWKIIITSSSGEVEERFFNPKDRNVLISCESSAIGDTLAWIPYVEEFRKKYKCNLFVSTFLNDLFEDQYTNINFVSPNTKIQDLYAHFRIGVWYNDEGVDYSKSKVDYRDVGLQEIATEILGLEYKEIRPKIKKPRSMKSKTPYVCIGPNSTAQAKYWNNPTGWQELVNYLRKNGYDVYLLSKYGDGYMGNNHPSGVIPIINAPLLDVAKILLGSKGFIGLGSGLSWYSWSLGVPTMLISGFSEPYQEMRTGIYRVINRRVCTSCFARHLFNKGDWNWCPDQKGTVRQFECTKSITFEMIKSSLNQMLEI